VGDTDARLSIILSADNNTGLDQSPQTMAAAKSSPQKHAMHSRRRIVRWRAGSPSKSEFDEVATEEPLEIQVETHPISVTMRTPGHDRELAAGFLLSEGVIERRDQIREIRPYPRNELGNALNVFLSEGVAIDLGRLTRHVFASSSCGLCGKASIQAVQRHFNPIRSKWTIRAGILPELSVKMRHAQETFDSTGGLHAVALFDADGNLKVLREDVGRHNAMDKVLGHALMEGWLPLDRHAMFVSGRASFELVQKALAGGVSILCAVSAPSSLAVDLARKSGLTLVGFLRDTRFNIYSGAHRIVP
jgi:FdhD protein